MTDTASLVAVSDATRMLSEARTLDDVRHVLDIAEAARLYARKARLGLDAQNAAAAVSVEAQARAAEMLEAARKAGELAEQGRPSKTSQAVTYSDLDVSKMEASRWAAVADVPAPKRAEYVSRAIEEREEITRAGLLRYAAGSPLAP